MKRGYVPHEMSNALHTFSRAPQANIPRSTFNRSHGHKTTFNAGYLIPVYVDEALPGDTFNLHMHAFARMATPLVPIMDNLVLESFFFAVPYRLVWENWERFNGSQDDPGDSTDYTIPTLSSGLGFPNGNLEDYFGMPCQIANITVNALHHRAYNLIWNEWFRDQNLQDSLVVQTDDGPDTLSNYNIVRRGKRYDYFTSCLPFPQKGPSVELPLGTFAPIVSDVNLPTPGTGIPTFDGSGSGTNQSLNVPSPSNVVASALGTLSWHTSSLVADLTTATAATINQLRQAFQLQKLYERDARGGTRYTEIIRSHFGVISPDMRLQRPEYLGGGYSPVIINPIAQTAPKVTSATSSLGDLGAYGICTVQGHGFTKSFTEHCLILGMVCVRADLTYQQGLNRMFSRQTRFDYYWPALSHIGEQAVLNQEIYAQGTSDDTGVFGYQERYAEYRYKPSIVTGAFNSNSGTPVDFWHLAQQFTSLPLLNDEFIQENPPMGRILAVTDDEEFYNHFLFDSFFSLQCARPMPVYSVPGLVDHF